MLWLNNYASAIQAIAAVAVALLTSVLAWSTIRYSRDTRQALRLARQQFQREWEPDLRVATVYRSNDLPAALELANMSKAAAFVVAVRIGTGRGEQQDIETFPANLLVPGGETRNLRVDKELSQYRRMRGPKPFIEGSTWEAICGISLTYGCSGRTTTTPWFNLVANFHALDVMDVRPY